MILIYIAAIALIISLAWKLFIDISEWLAVKEWKQWIESPESPRQTFPEADDGFREWLTHGTIQDLMYTWVAFSEAQMSDEHLNDILNEIIKKHGMEKR